MSEVTQAQKNMRAAVYEYLSAHPERHNQDSVYENKEDQEYFELVSTDIHLVTDEPVQYYNNCGTTMCIAGATMLFHAMQTNENVADLEWVSKSAELLGLEYGAAHDLFHIYDNEKALSTLKELAYGDN